MYVIHTTLDHDEAVMHVQSYMGQQWWTLTHKDAKSLTFNRTKKPGILILILLLLLWVFPGILYLIFAWKKQTCNVFIGRSDNKTKITFEAGVNSKYYGRSLAQYLSHFDPKLDVPPQPPQKRTVSDYVVYAIYGGLGFVMVALFLLYVFS